MSIFIQIFPVGSAKRFFSARVHFDRLGSSKIIDFDVNWKRASDFLLDSHSNLGPILHRFRDIAGFVLLTPPLFHSNFRMFPLDQIADVGVSPSIYSNQPWNYFRSIPTCVITLPERQRPTDRQRYCGISALCVASRGKNRVYNVCPVLMGGGVYIARCLRST